MPSAAGVALTTLSNQRLIDPSEGVVERANDCNTGTSLVEGSIKQSEGNPSRPARPIS